MARCCGGTGSCACKVTGGRLTQVTGLGTTQDPLVIDSEVAFSTEDTKTFDLGLTGDGSLDSPWRLTAAYAPTAQLSDIPDVGTVAPTSGQVLAWNSATGQWTPVPPVTASPGSVTTDNSSVLGDGSAGNPLRAKQDGTRYMQVTATGIGLTNQGINRLVRVFPDATARAQDAIQPAVNTISLLATTPGRIDYWDGNAWQQVTNGIGQSVANARQMLSLSGPYAGGPITQYVEQVNVTAAADGTWEAIPATVLAGRGGVLSCTATMRGGTPAHLQVIGDVNRIKGYAWRVTDGSVYAGLSITATVQALLY